MQGSACWLLLPDNTQGTVLSSKPAIPDLTITVWCCRDAEFFFVFYILHVCAFFFGFWIYEWSLVCVCRMHHWSDCRFARKGHRKLVGGSAFHNQRKHSEALTNEAFRKQDSGSVVNVQMSCCCNFWCLFAYNYHPFVPGVRAFHRSQFDTRAAAAAAEPCREEWERVGGLMWNKNPISSQLGSDLFVCQFSVSLMSPLWFYLCVLCVMGVTVFWL